MAQPEAEARQPFLKHEAKRTPLPDGLGEIISWRNPRTVIDSLVYILYGRYLLVFGDLGDAVYEWSERVSLAFLAGCNINYFASKCRASENGRGNNTWNSGLAQAAIDQQVREVEKLFDDDLLAEAREAAEHPQTWAVFLGECDGIKLFGSESWEFADVGFVPSARCRYHLEGLKMIHEREKAVPRTAAETPEVVLDHLE